MTVIMFSSSYGANLWSSKRGEIHKLLPQTHSPGVDYSLFIMETVEKSLEKMETAPAALHRSFPPPICNSRSLFLGFCVSAALPSERRQETIFIVVFRSRRRHGDENGRHRSNEGKRGALTRLGNLAVWDPQKSSSDFLSCATLAPTLCSFQKMVPAKY